MKKTSVMAIGLMLITMGQLTQIASGAPPEPGYSGPAILAQAGAIHGQVLCGEETGTPTPRAWATVWVAGQGLSARTDIDGYFQIDFVPPGEYTLGVQTAGQMIRTPTPNTVVVTPRAVNEITLTVIGGCGGCAGGGGHDDGGGCEGDEGGCSGGGGSEPPAA